MRYEHNMQNPNFSVANIHVIRVIRGKGFVNFFRDGRTYHGFIYVVRGAIRCDFSDNTPESIPLTAGDLLFIPEGTVYSSAYTAEETEIEIVQFELTSGKLPY